MGFTFAGRKLRSILPGLSMITMLLCSTAMLSAQTIVRNGQPAASIIIPADANKNQALAAKELQTHIKLISGAELPIIKQGEKPAGLPIYLGSAADEKYKQKLTQTSKDEYALRIVVTKDQAHLLGNTDDGVLAAVSELLEQLGVRWYFPGEYGVDVIESKDITLKVQDTIDAPLYIGRYLQAVSDREWTRRMKLGGLNAGGHGLGPRFDNVQRPDLFYRYEDGRVSHQEKVSEPEVLAATIKFWREKLKENPNIKYISVGPHDGAGFGNDPWDADDFDPILGQVATTDRYIKFFNTILEDLQKDYPDVGLAFYAYTQEMRPPVREKPNPKILPMLAAIGLDRFHSVNNPLSWEKKYLKTVIEGWQALGVNMMFRGYLFNLADHGLPFSMIDIVKEEWPYYYDKGFIAMRVECLPNYGYHTPALYLAAKLYWNPKANPDQIMEEYWKRLYGPAANAMKEHFDIVENAYINADYYTGNVFDVPKILTPEVRKQMQRTLEQAEKAAKGNEKYEYRVKLTRVAFDYGEANFKMMAAFNASDFKTAKEAYDHILNDIVPVSSSMTPNVIGARFHVGYLKRFWGRSVDHAAERIINNREVAAVLPDEWLTFLDPYNAGDKLFLFDPQLGTNSWRPLKTFGDSTSNQGLRYYKDSIWYRNDFTVPAKYNNRLLRLWMGGVDDTARVWVDGKELPLISRGGAPIGIPWEFDGHGIITPGKQQVIVIKVSDNAVNELGTVGITGPIMIWAENPSVTNEQFQAELAETRRKAEEARIKRDEARAKAAAAREARAKAAEEAKKLQEQQKKQ